LDESRQNLGVNSYSTFLSTPSAQDAAFQNFTQKNFNYLHNSQSYIGKTIGGIHITEAGLLAGAHLLGAGNVEKYLSSDGTHVAVDGLGTPITQYMQKFSQYNFTFPANASGFSAAIDSPSMPEPNQHTAHNTASTAEANALKGKTPVERARHHAAQARANAAKNPLPAYMQIYDMLMNLGPQLPSIAPIAGGAGQQKTALPQRTGVSDAVGLPAPSRPPGAAASLAAGTGAGYGATPTGFRKIIADAHAQAAQTKAQRAAGRAAAGLPSQGGDLSGRSFAPIPRNGAASNIARAASPETNWPQEQMSTDTAGQLGPQGAVNASSARPQPGQDGNAHSVWHEIEHVLADLSPFALERALENYFHRLSRRPPIGGAAHNPALSPIFAGQKLPG
jgi:hypothetical protein